MARIATVSTEVFAASELSDKAKEFAREKFASAWDSNDTDRIIEMFESRLAELGLPADDIQWSLGYSQGDGVAFYGDVDLAKLASADETFASIVAALPTETSVRLYSISNHYSHWNTMRVETELMDDDGNEDHSAELAALESALLAKIQSVSRELERDGYEEIEYQSSMEVFLETAEANEWEFTADGRMF